MTSFFATLLAAFSLSALACFLGAVAGVILFVRGFAFSRGKPVRKAISISKMLKGPLGPAEVSGVAAGPYPVTAPITGAECFAYRTVVWRQKQAGNGTPDEMVAEERLQVPFFLDDNTGQLLIDPAGAELDLRQDFRHEFNDTASLADNQDLQNVRDFLRRHGISDGGKLRIEEYCVKPKTFLYIHGTLARNPGLAVAPRSLLKPEAPVTVPVGNSSMFLSEFPGPMAAKSDDLPADVMPALREIVDLTSALPAADSSAGMTQQGKIAAALQRAGMVLPDIRTLMSERYESELGENAMPEKVPGPAETGNGHGSREPGTVAREFDLKPALMLMKGKGAWGYVISWREPRKAAPPMQWKTAVMLWGGPALTLLSLSLLAALYGWL